MLSALRADAGGPPALLGFRSVELTMPSGHALPTVDAIGRGYEREA
jgi:hypothetical protein